MKHRPRGPGRGSHECSGSREDRPSARVEEESMEGPGRGSKGEKSSFSGGSVEGRCAASVYLISIQGVAMGLLDNSQDPFENFRREKKMRALQRELQRRMESRQGQILKLIEQEERSEVLERQIQREMRDFFEDSTKLAATVLAEVAEQKAREISAQITMEMQEFFREVLLRAERTIQGIRLTHRDDQPEKDVETHLDPSLSEAFGGRPKEAEEEEEEPLQVEILNDHEENPPLEKAREPEPPPSQAGEEEENLLGGEVYVPEPDAEEELHASPAGDETPEIQMDEEEEEFLPDEHVGEKDEDRMKTLLQNLSKNPTKLKEALTALYRAGVIDREEARSLYTAYSKR